MIRVGLIGCGYWGANLCRVLAEHPRVELRWVSDKSPSALDRARRLAPSARHIYEADVAQADADVDAVIVAVPVESHHAVAKTVLEAGKHVLVEKPLARTSIEAEDLCLEANQRALVLMVGHTFLYNAAVRRIKRMIDSDDLGDIRYILTRRLNLGIVRQDVDVLWNLAPHDLSLLNYWIDKPVVAAGAIGHSFLQPGIADVVFAHLTYEGNIAGHIQVSWLDPSKVRQATIVGSRKMLLYDDTSADSRITVFDKGIDIEHLDTKLGTFETFAQHQLMVRAGDVWIPQVDFKEPLVVEIDDFVSSVEEGRTPLADGLSGLEVVKLLERLSAAMRRGVLDGE